MDKIIIWSIILILVLGVVIFWYYSMQNDGIFSQEKQTNEKPIESSENFPINVFEKMQEELNK